MEIGSEFCLNNKLGQNNESKFRYNAYFMSGRSAIEHIISELDSKIISKTVLLPDYLCSSIMSSFNAKNYKFYFYKIDNNLKPKIDYKILNKHYGIIFGLSYFGKQTNQDLNININKFKYEYYIEDVTHSFLSNLEYENEPDYFVASIRKWFGICSGGILGSNKYKISEAVFPPNELFISLRKKSFFLKSSYFNSDKKDLATKKLFLSGFAEAEKILDSDNCDREIDFESKTIIKNIDLEYIKKSRIRNFNYLEKLLEKNIKIKTIFKLSDHEVPLFLPIYAPCRDKLRENLTKNNIFCPIHWPTPNIYASSNKYILKNILSLPIDQRYNIQEMDKIARCIDEFYITNSLGSKNGNINIE